MVKMYGKIQYPRANLRIFQKIPDLLGGANKNCMFEGAEGCPREGEVLPHEIRFSRDKIPHWGLREP